ncbi:exo-alpha-sialidase [Agromyces italicus]|uniref:exo-alpha-sialidase n=1 Tax=Agromyces italicus TaxID=279572 RepID=UPI00041AFE77|nr:exo-alpha-sialidase [Agromyces italicus]
MNTRLLSGLAAGAVAAACLTPAAAANAAEPPPAYHEQVLAVGTGGMSNQQPPYGHELGAFFNYRIPAVVQLNDGDLLVSYDGRPTAEDSPGPNSILQRRSTDGGVTWGPETFIHEGVIDDPTIADDRKSGYSDPSYVYDEETGTLFNFHVFSKDAGFVTGAYGNDDADRDVVSAEVSVSSDGGETWEHRSVTGVFKGEDVRAAFASSGHGIQIENGPHAGRLVVQFVGSFSDATLKAFSLYSDDHGETWQRGTPVGTNMDENKVVELSDGTLMLNSRIHSGHKARYVAYSEDGGETWSEPEVDAALVDPVNNASIIRKNADAEPGTSRSKELLFSNAASAVSRSNGTVRYSCDDGATWPVERVFASGGMSYSDLVALDSGGYGLFYEGESGQLRYASFSEEWLNPFCANIAPISLDVTAGVPATATVTIRNDDDRDLPAGEVTANVAEGWTADIAEMPALAPGEEATVEVEVTAPATTRVTTSAIPADIVVAAGEYSFRGSLNVDVTVGSTVPGEDGDHGVRTCLEGQSEPALDAPVALNVVANCSFEAKDSVSSKAEWEWFGAGDTSHPATETLDDGSENTYALIDAGAIDNHIWQAVPTVPGRSYVVSADVNVGAADGYVPSAVFLTTKGMNPDGSQNQGATTQLSTGELISNGWSRKTFTFTAKNWNTFVGIVKWAAQDAERHVANTTIAMDNLTVYEQESYDLVWNDEFDGDALNQEDWGYELGNVRGNEQQHYSSSTDNVDVADGALILAATDRPLADQYRNTARWGDRARVVKYNSGSVRTEGREEFLYGRIEARMSLPEGKGVFPAFWMLGADFHMDGRVNMEHGYSWPSTGELDIMEIIGAPTEERAAQGEVGKAGNSNAVTYGTPHFYYTGGDADGDGSYAPTALGGNLSTAESLSEGYHVYGIDWNPEYIAWYVDGVVFNIMYFPTDSTTAAGNEAFIASEVARFQAAADSLNRPQYLQLNLATGGNWAGDAGDHLAEDGAAFKVDWVRYYRSAAQQAAADAYYAGQPEITGAVDRVMRAGEAADLLDGVGVSEGYVVEYSINDEQMFVNGGVEGGRNEVHLVVADASDTAALQSLAPGVYSLHYSALEEGVAYSGGITPVARAARQRVLLTVLPGAGLQAEGATLASVALPDGWSWSDETQSLDGDETAYAAVFTQAGDTGADPAKRRAVRIEIPADQIARVDDGAPAVTASLTQRNEIVLAATDAVSDGIRIEYSTQKHAKPALEWREYSEPFRVDAKTVVSVRATDGAGNTSEIRTFTRNDLD